MKDKKSGGPEANGPRDPVEVLRLELARRAKLHAVFREAGLTQSEIDDINYAMDGARGLGAVLTRKDKRALDLLMAGRPDWFECLLRNPAKVSSTLRVALAQFAASLP